MAGSDLRREIFKGQSNLRVPKAPRTCDLSNGSPVHSRLSQLVGVALVCTPCCMLLGVVARSLVKLWSQQRPTSFLFRDL